MTAGTVHGATERGAAGGTANRVTMGRGPLGASLEVAGNLLIMSTLASSERRVR